MCCDMFVEEVYELGFFGGRGVVDVVFEEEAAEFGDFEGVGVEARLEVWWIFVHDGGGFG